MSLSFDPFRSKRLYNDLAISLSPGPFSYLTSLFEKEVAALTGKEVERYSQEEVLKAGLVQVSEMFGAAHITACVGLQGKDYTLSLRWKEHPTQREDSPSWLRLDEAILLKKVGARHDAVVYWELSEDDIEVSRFVRGAAQNPRTAEMLHALFMRLYEADYLESEVKERLSFFATLLKTAGYL